MLQFLFTKTPLVFLVQSFWRDEAFSHFLAGQKFLDIIRLSVYDFTPPLYYLMLHLWEKTFGITEISLRSFSFVFFWATVMVIFYFLTDIFKLSTKKSFFYLILFLLNPFLIYYAFEARNYTLLAFFASLSYYFFIRRKDKYYFIATLLGLYTHYFMFFVVMSQFTYNFLLYKKGLRRNTLNKLIFKPVLFFIPWFIFVLFSKNFFASAFWIKKLPLKSVFDIFGIVYTGYEYELNFYDHRITAISVLLMIIAGLGYWLIRKSKIDKKLLNILLLWGVGIPVFVFLISFVKPIFLPRYFIFSSIGLILLLVYLMENLKPLPRYFAFLLLILITINFQSLQIRQRRKKNFQKALNEINAIIKKDDLVYVTSELDFFTAKYYLDKNKNLSKKQIKVYIYNKSFEEIPDFVGKILISKNDLAPMLPVYPRKAFVLKHDGSYTIQALY